MAPAPTLLGSLGATASAWESTFPRVEAELQGLLSAKNKGHRTVPQTNGHVCTGLAPNLFSGKGLHHATGRSPWLYSSPGDQRNSVTGGGHITSVP